MLSLRTGKLCETEIIGNTDNKQKWCQQGIYFYFQSVNSSINTEELQHLHKTVSVDNGTFFQNRVILLLSDYMYIYWCDSWEALRKVSMQYV